MKHKKKGFTVVELITVIIILIILATIGFMSYGGYLIGVRDTNRISQISGIDKALNSYGVKARLPLPDDYVTVEVAGGVIGYQGYAGASVLKIINFEKGGKDPLDEEYYTYYLTKNKKHSQMLSLLEEEQLSFNGINNTYASSDYSERIVHTFGKQLGVLTEDITNIPIQEIGDIKASKKIELHNEIRRFRATFKTKDYITKVGSNLLELKEVSDTGGKGCTAISGSIICGTDSVTKIVDSRINIVGDDTAGRKWSNETIAKLCSDYRTPTEGYRYNGSTGNGTYWINPTQNPTSSFKVYCDMTFDGGGWTYATMLAGNNGTLFNTNDTTNYVSNITSISSKGKLSNVWPTSDTKKDIMLKCNTDNVALKGYEIPFIIHDYNKDNISILENHNGNIGTLKYSWDNNNNKSIKNSISGNFILKNGNGDYIWKLSDGDKIYGYYNAGPSIAPTNLESSSPGIYQKLNSNNFCITAIR